MGNVNIGKLVVLSVIAVVVLIVFLASTYKIDAGERGVVLKMGKVDRVAGEGFHWKAPFIESVKKLDVKTMKIEVPADAASRDLQSVHATIALNYNLNPVDVGVLWQEIGADYRTRIIDPAIQESVKSATALFTAEELITKRHEVKEMIQLQLSEELIESYMRVTNVSIVDFSFSASFDTAIEAKVTAEQKALEAENKLEQVKFEAEQKIATAIAEAESVRLQAQALSQNNNYIQLKKLEVELERAKKWNGVLPVNIYGSAPIPFLNVGN